MGLLAMQSPELAQSGNARTLSASIAAKCLRPILQFQVMFRHRAELYRQIRKACTDLKKLSASTTPHARWRFAVITDLLNGLLLEMSKHDDMLIPHAMLGSVFRLSTK